ncbi:MAG: hypothetical protein O2967_22180 [Proteobacteria bacterium]|nr:hypothetical protein [Pseudomonadota bacterium]
MSVSITEAMRDPHLFGPFFANPKSWRAWTILLKAIFALPMDAAELPQFRRLTSRNTAPTEQAEEAWLIVGRRGGKSFIVALIAVFLACFKDYSKHLAPGERGTIMVLAADRRQARVIFRYATALIEGVPMLAQMVERITADAIDLSNGISIEVHTASFRTVRGYTVVAALCDETAFWRDDSSANPDREILDALRPAMATIPGALLICLGSPYRRHGALWEAFRDHHGKDCDPILVLQAASRTMNPTLSQKVVDRAYERDPVAASSEYGGEFRSDLDSYIPREVLEALVERGVRERGPLSERSYIAFADPAGGSGSDSYTLAIAYYDDGQAVLVALRETKPPFSPEAVTADYAALLKRYDLSTVHGDRYAGDWPAERFQTHGISYKPAGLSKSDIYRELLPALNAGEVALLDHDRLIGQLASLERRAGRSGKDSIDHPQRGHDDVANAAAGALWLAPANLPVAFTDAMYRIVRRPPLDFPNDF